MADIWKLLATPVKTPTETLVAGTVDFYNPGTTGESNRKDVYTDSAGTIVAANPYTLDSDATAVLYGSGLYHVVIKDSSGNTEYDYDFITPDKEVYAFAPATLAELQAITGYAGATANLLARTTLGDGGGGQFYWDSSDLSTEVTADTQSGIYVAPDSDATGASGAWVRDDKTLTPEKFGAVGDGSTDDSTAVQALLNFIPAATATEVITSKVYAVADISIPAGVSGVRFVGPSRQFDPTAGFKGVTASDTLFSVDGDIYFLGFDNVSLQSCGSAIKIPTGSLVSNLYLNGSTFNTVTKGIDVADTFANGTGIISGFMSQCETYNTQYAFYAVHNSLVNNFHFDLCTFENPADGGYQVYIGGLDTTLETTNISITQSLFNGTVSTTSIPIYLGGRISNASLSEVHFSDFGLTGGTNDDLELITIAGDTGGVGVYSLSLNDCDVSSTRGPLINKTASNPLGVISLKNNRLYSSAEVLTNADNVARIVSIGNTYGATDRISENPNLISIGDVDNGTSLPENISTLKNSLFPIAISVNQDIPAGEIGCIYLGTTGAGTLIVKLPLANAVPKGATYTFKKDDAGAGDFYIQRNSSGADTIDGGTEIYLPDQKDWATVVSDGVSAWSSFGLGIN